MILAPGGAINAVCEGERMDDLRKLDAEVAEKVMGWTKIVYDPKVPDMPMGMDPERNSPRVIPGFSSEVDNAWAVVEAMRGKGCTTIEIELRGDKWTAMIGPPAESKGGSGTPVGFAVADTMPLAVCRAALSALEAK